jgi:hypothetical protein
MPKPATIRNEIVKTVSNLLLFRFDFIFFKMNLKRLIVKASEERLTIRYIYVSIKQEEKQYDN